MDPGKFHIILADDDLDDCLLFEDALDEYPLAMRLSIFHHGEQLMQQLGNKTEPLPDLLFLDLNMPRKTGFECLAEIKQDERLKQLPVIILSTSFQKDVVNLLYSNGAQYFIRKPNEFSQLREVIHQALSNMIQTNLSQPPKEKFVLSQ
ncbi:MAG: response regulator [Gloeobacteraceae cyanobacterium ES-bin-316]|nr:response regulator [Ferruginibacter sp.]